MHAQIRSADVPQSVNRISAAEYRALIQSKPVRLPNSFDPAIQKPKSSSEILPRDPFPVATEHEEQANLVQWLIYLGIRHFAIPNGSLRHIAVAGKLRAEGVVSGPSDLVILPEVGDNLPIVFLEMKRSKGGKTSDAQKDFLEHITDLQQDGHKVCSRVANGFDAARQMLMEIGYGCTRN